MRRIKLSGLIAFPEPILEIIKDAEIYDSSCSPEARVYFVDKEDGMFLKEAEEEALCREASMTAFFHTLGLSAEMLYYGSSNEKDYMITRRIPGEDCTYEIYLGNPKRLCDLWAKLLRSLHETDASECPIQSRMETYRKSVEAGLSERNYEPDLFKGIWEFASFDEAAYVAKEGLVELKSEVLLHGDYCLPNVILDNWRLSGYIDLGNGGIGDRHIDILWGIWTLKYNLGTALYTDRFMDAYGRDAIDEEKLRAIAAMEMVGV